MKPGYKTSELAINVVVTIAALLIASGALAEGGIAVQIAGFVVALASNLGYMGFRTGLKSDEAIAKAVAEDVAQVESSS